MFGLIGKMGGGWDQVLQEILGQAQDEGARMKFDGPAIAGGHGESTPTPPIMPPAGSSDIDQGERPQWRNRIRTLFDQPQAQPGNVQNEPPPLEASAGKMAGWGAGQLLKMFL